MIGFEVEWRVSKQWSRHNLLHMLSIEWRGEGAYLMNCAIMQSVLMTIKIGKVKADRSPRWLYKVVMNRYIVDPTCEHTICIIIIKTLKKKYSHLLFTWILSIFLLDSKLCCVWTCLNDSGIKYFRSRRKTRLSLGLICIVDRKVNVLSPPPALIRINI